MLFSLFTSTRTYQKTGNYSLIGTTQIIAGNHHDGFELKGRLQQIFKDLKGLSLDIKGAYFKADSAFDSKEGRKVCWNQGVIPNII